MNRIPYEQNEPVQRSGGREFEGYLNPYLSQQSSLGYFPGTGAGGLYGQPINEFENRYVGFGPAGRFTGGAGGYGIEQERMARQWPTPHYPGPQAFIGPQAWQYGPAGLPLQTFSPDPFAPAYYQGLAARGYIGQSPALGSAFLGQSPAYRTLGPSLYDPMNRMAGYGLGEFPPVDIGLHQQQLQLQQQLLQQQLMQQQQLQPSPFQRQQLGAPSLRGLGPKGFVRSDERLKEEVCERLTQHPGIDASDITVEARQGVVILGGTVTDRLVKHQVEDLIDDVIGVKDIENHITVRPRAPLEGMAGRSQIPGQGEAPAGKPRH